MEIKAMLYVGVSQSYGLYGLLIHIYILYIYNYIVPNGAILQCMLFNFHLIREDIIKFHNLPQRVIEPSMSFYYGEFCIPFKTES